jgi:hypothetical protein
MLGGGWGLCRGSKLQMFLSAPWQCVELQKTRFKTATFSLRPMAKYVLQEMYSKTYQVLEGGGLLQCFACQVPNIFRLGPLMMSYIFLWHPLTSKWPVRAEEAPIL